MNCNYNVESVNQFIAEHIENKGKISDTFHTFDELYDFRKMYNAALFNEWASEYIKNVNLGWMTLQEENTEPKYDVHKSLRHFDGEECFGGGWFIVLAMLPTGQISNHYPISDWDLFKLPVTHKAKYEYDGHTPSDVLERLKSVL